MLGKKQWRFFSQAKNVSFRRNFSSFLWETGGWGKTKTSFLPSYFSLYPGLALRERDFGAERRRKGNWLPTTTKITSFMTIKFVWKRIFFRKKQQFFNESFFNTHVHSLQEQKSFLYVIPQRKSVLPSATCCVVWNRRQLFFLKLAFEGGRGRQSR